jgi:archaellum component FlaC
MSFLDKMKETAQKGVEKTKEAVSAGQDMLEARKLENDIGELKEELGGIVYAQKTGSPPDDADAEIERLVGEIQSAEAELATYDRESDDDTTNDANAATDATAAGDSGSA